VNAVVKRSVTIRGHRTSYSLEQPFYDELLAISAARGIPLAALVGEIDGSRSRDTNLSSALRLFVLDWFRTRSASASNVSLSAQFPNRN
jgi:predicted DNA-binding ribbon-helix-helix protein